jgi:tetratricopeptide (TPR) repeat protein
LLSRGETPNRPEIARALAEFETLAPKSYIGWAATQGYAAQAYNVAGLPAQAKAVCERALAHVTDRDRDYVLHFLTLDRELAIADAALGRTDEALARIDALLERYGPTEHALALGLLHEARARIAWAAGKFDDYYGSLREVERRFLPAREPALTAKYQRLRDLAGRDGPGKEGSAFPTAEDVASASRTTASVTHSADSAETVVAGKNRRGGNTS